MLVAIVVVLRHDPRPRAPWPPIQLLLTRSACMRVRACMQLYGPQVSPAPVVGVVLQAPVSDREWLQGMHAQELDAVAKVGPAHLRLLASPLCGCFCSPSTSGVLGSEEC